MEEIQIFSNPDFGEVRTVVIGDKVHFVANDVARMLGYKRPYEAITAHCKGAVKYRDLTEGGMQEMRVIPEGDIYRLIIKSQLPIADKFERWVFDEIIPSIRRTGTYGMPSTTGGQIQLLAQGYVELEQKVAELDKRSATTDQRLEVLEDTSVVNYQQRRKLKSAGVHKVVKILGGKSSNSYQNSVIRTRAFQFMWHEYREHFELTTYHDTPKVKYEDALKYIEGWEPPTNLRLEIAECNEVRV